MAATTAAVKFRSKAETTWGTTATGTYDEHRIRGETLTPSLEYVESEAIRSDGQIPSLRLVDAQGGGRVLGELAYGEWDKLMEMALLSVAFDADTAKVKTSATISAVAPTATVPGYFEDTTAATWVSALFTDGMWVKISGFTGGGAVNNTVWKVVEVTTTRLYVTGGVVVAAAVGSTITATQMLDIANGTTQSSRTFEIENSDDTDQFHQFPGGEVQSMRLNVPQKGNAQIEFEIISKRPTSVATSAASGNNAPPTTEQMTSGDATRFLEGDVQLGTIAAASLLWNTATFKVLEFSCEVTPSLRTRNSIGVIGPSIRSGRGTFRVTGSVRLYYNTDPGATSPRDDKTLLNKAQNDTASAMALVMLDPAKNVYIFDFPTVKFTSGSVEVPGRDQDVILNLTFTGYVNTLDINPNAATVSGVTMRIARGVHP